jgi:ribonuclease BN (tRNA processing enzyme)
MLEHLSASSMLAEDAGKIAARAAAKTLMLNHLVPSDDPRSPTPTGPPPRARTMPARIIVARDLMEMAVA